MPFCNKFSYCFIAPQEEIKAAVGHTLAKEVTLLRGAMEEQFQASNAKLLAKLAELGG